MSPDRLGPGMLEAISLLCPRCQDGDRNLSLFMDTDVASAPNTAAPQEAPQSRLGCHTVPLTLVWGLRMLILRALGAMQGAKRGVL